MQKLFLHYGSAVALLLLWWCGGIRAQIQPPIDIEKQSSSELPMLAVPQFLGETADPALAQQLRSVLQQDMKYTGLFRIADQATYPEVPQSVEQLQYPSWAALGVIAVITGRLGSAAGDGQAVLPAGRAASTPCSPGAAGTERQQDRAGSGDRRSRSAPRRQIP